MKINDDLEKVKTSLINNYLQLNCKNQQIPLKSFMRIIEKDVIGKALRITRGNQRIASFILGLKPTTLNEKIKKLDLKDNLKFSVEEELKELVKETDISTI